MVLQWKEGSNNNDPITPPRNILILMLNYKYIEWTEQPALTSHVGIDKFGNGALRTPESLMMAWHDEVQPGMVLLDRARPELSDRAKICEPYEGAWLLIEKLLIKFVKLGALFLFYKKKSTHFHRTKY